MATNPLELNDEDFLKIPSSEFVAKAQEETPEPKTVEEPDTEVKIENGSETETETDVVVDDPDNKDDDPDKTIETEPDNKSEEDKSKESDEPKTEEKNPDGSVKEPEKTIVDKKADVDTAPVINYEEAYNKLLTPFKANGKDVKINNIDEAIRLMQAGAGYGKKLQQIQPHLKTVRMLENADLLDPNKLSYLIDLHQKNPDAIKKLIKDSGIDPLDLNTNDEVSYIPTDHSVTDTQMAFSDALQEVSAHPEGKETLKIINSTWDKESKNTLFAQPELLVVIQSQRDNGLYDQIADEIDRQKLLGDIPVNTPFIKAYKIAGDYLVKQDKLSKPDTINKSEKIIIDTKVATVKSQVKNNEKAQAAASTQTNSTRKAASTVNPLSVDDESFMKQFNGRL